MIRVLLADDQALLLEGLAALLGAEPDIEIAGVARNGREAIDLARTAHPDVAVLDVRMPELDGISAARELSAGGVRVLMLTTFDVDQHVYDAIRAGASGFLLKDAPRGRLARAIRDVAAGEMLVDPVVTRRLVEKFARRPSAGVGPPAELADLSDRELEVMRAVARGRSNQEVGEELHLSAATVKTHVASILRKLGERDRVQLVIRAYESGLVEPGG